jgi:hypothetical protein
VLKHADMSGSASCDVSQGVSRIVEMQSTDLHSAFRPHIHHEVTRQEKGKNPPNPRSRSQSLLESEVNHLIGGLANNDWGGRS